MKVKSHSIDLLMSLLPPDMQQVWLSNKLSVKSSIISTLSKRAQRFYEDEQIVLFSDAGKFHQDGTWNVIDLVVSNYPRVFVHRWLSLYVLNKLSPEVRLDKKTLADFILKTSHITPPFLKRLAKVDLSGEDVTGLDSGLLASSDIYLSGANLSGANLSGANLSSVFLDYADLSHANLTFTNLSESSLFYANLFEADLSNANLNYADLSHANLTATILQENTGK